MDTDDRDFFAPIAGMNAPTQEFPHIGRLRGEQPDDPDDPRTVDGEPDPASASVTREVEAIVGCSAAFDGLTPAERRRVLMWLSDKYTPVGLLIGLFGHGGAR